MLSTDESFVHPWNWDRVPYAETSPHKAVSSRGLKLSPNCIASRPSNNIWVNPGYWRSRTTKKQVREIGRAKLTGEVVSAAILIQETSIMVSGLRASCHICQGVLFVSSKHVPRRAKRDGCGETSRALAELKILLTLNKLQTCKTRTSFESWSNKSNEAWKTRMIYGAQRLYLAAQFKPENMAQSLIFPFLLPLLPSYQMAWDSFAVFVGKVIS